MTRKGRVQVPVKKREGYDTAYFFTEHVIVTLNDLAFINITCLTVSPVPDCQCMATPAAEVTA